MPCVLTEVAPPLPTPVFPPAPMCPLCLTLLTRSFTVQRPKWRCQLYGVSHGPEAQVSHHLWWWRSHAAGRWHLDTRGSKVQEPCSGTVPGRPSCRTRQCGIHNVSVHLSGGCRFWAVVFLRRRLAVGCPLAERTAWLLAMQCLRVPACCLHPPCRFSTRQHVKASDDQEAYPVYGLHASCNAQRQIHSFDNICWKVNRNANKPEPASS